MTHSTSTGTVTRRRAVLGSRSDGRVSRNLRVRIRRQHTHDRIEIVCDRRGGFGIRWETATAIKTFDSSWSLPTPADRRIALEFGFASPRDLEATYQALTTTGARYPATA